MRYATLDALRSVFTLGARVVHFAGHGHPNFLCFEDARGGAVALSPESLRDSPESSLFSVRVVTATLRRKRALYDGSERL